MGIVSLLFGKSTKEQELEERWKLTLKEARDGIDEMDEARKKLRIAKDNIHARAVRIKSVGDENGRKEGRTATENVFARKEFKSSPG